MENAASQKWIVRLMMVGLFGYMIAAIGYAIYGAETSTGLPGYVMTLEMYLMGEAGEKLSILASIMVYLVLLIPICWVTGKLAPEASRELQLEMKRMNQPANAKGTPIGWDTILWITGLMLVATFLLAGAFYLHVKRDEKATVYQVNLETQGAEPVKKSGFIELNAVLARSFYAGYTTGTTKADVYYPLVQTGWTAATPAKYFVHYETSNLTDGKPTYPDAFHVRGATVFMGKLGSQLPVYVARRYEGKGLKIDPSYTMIDWEEIYNHEAPKDDGYSYFIALGVGVMVTLITLLSMVLVRVQHAKLLKAQGSPARQTMQS